MKTNLVNLSANYKVQTIHIALSDGILLPVSVIGSGKPVILLHAYGMDAREFLPFILPLVGKYAFNMPMISVS